MQNPQEQDEETKAQDFMFKLNLVLFAGTITVINVSKSNISPVNTTQALHQNKIIPFSQVSHVLKDA